MSVVAIAKDGPHCPEPITLALYEHGYLYDKASNRGIDKDVAEELSKRSGCRFEMSVQPRARIWHALETGRLMMSVSGIQTPERDAFASFVPYMSLKNYVLVNSALDVKSAAEFAANPKLLWGTVRAFKHGKKADEFLEQLRGSSRVRESADSLSVMQIFALPNRTSATFAQPPVYAKYIKELGIAPQVRIEDWFPEDAPVPLGLVFSKKHFSPSEVQKWSDIVQKMRADGSLKLIYERYLGADGARRMLR
jgi:polar amino acid transport system substrate-binding protein